MNAVVPFDPEAGGAPTTPAAAVHSSPARLAAHEQLVMLALCFLGAVPAVGGVLLAARFLSAQADAVEAAGVVVQLSEGRVEEAETTELILFLGAGQGALLAAYFAAVAEQLRGKLPRAVVGWFAVAALSQVAWTCIFLLDPEQRALRLLVVFGACAGAATAGSRFVGAAAGVPRWLAAAQLLVPMAYLGINLNATGALLSGSEPQRVLWRIVGHPLVTAAALLPARAMVRLSPAPCESTGAMAMVLLVFAALVGRMQLQLMETAAGTVAAVLGSAAVESALRLRASALDWHFLRVVRGRAHADAALEMGAGARATLELFTELAEGCATLVATAIVLAFRAGFERQAPEPQAALLSCALQLATEAAIDVLPWVGAFSAARHVLGRVGGSPADLQEHLVLRARTLAGFDRRVVALCVGQIAVSAVLSAASFHNLMQATFMCPWSSAAPEETVGGWWHFAPCVRTREWWGE